MGAGVVVVVLVVEGERFADEDAEVAHGREARDEEFPVLWSESWWEISSKPSKSESSPETSSTLSKSESNSLLSELALEGDRARVRDGGGRLLERFVST